MHIKKYLPPKSLATWSAARAVSFSIWFSHNITLAAEIMIFAAAMSVTVKNALDPLTVIILFCPFGKTVSCPTPVEASFVKVI